MKNFAILLCLGLFFSCSSKKESSKAKDYCSSIHVNNGGGLEKSLENIAAKMKDSTAAQILEDGGGALITRAWFCEKAEKSIDIQYFIFSPDNVGLIACDYLVRAADRGVKVRMLIDDMMVDADFEDILTLDTHPNIEVKIYNPGVNMGKNLLQKIGKFAGDFRSANQRMHNKTFIVDGKIAITGGRNIADEYFDYDHEYNFRDRDVLLIGRSVNQFDTSFRQFWTNSLSADVSKLSSKKVIYAKNAYDSLHQYACNPGNFWPKVRFELDSFDAYFEQLTKSNTLNWVSDVSFVSDMPGKNTNTSGLQGGGLSTQKLIELISNAKHSIEIETPYLITTDLGKNLFKSVSKRGVKIRILTNSMASTDNLEAFSGYRRDRKALLKTGVSVYEFKPDARSRMQVMTGELQKKLNYKPIFGLHAKSMIIDDSLTIIGTFNLDPRSANLNTECFAVINNKKIAAQVKSSIETDFKPENSWLISPTFNPDKEVNLSKRLKVLSRGVVPKGIL